MIDVAIIGSGPAALTAAIYSARSGLKTVVYEKSKFGGLLSEIPHIANFPGYDGTGAELANTLKKQAESAGATIEYGECTAIYPDLIIDEEKISARAILIATGTEPKPLDIPTTTPVSYCALCDGPLYKGKNVLVIGGGNSAFSEALYLSDLAANLTIANRSHFRAEASLIDKVSAKHNVALIEDANIDQSFLDSFDAVFVYIGKHPATSFVPTDILGSDGLIITDSDFATTIPGVFAAGDVRSGSIKQAITAAAEGAAAAISVVDYLKKC